jgi:hypothetical protein
MFKHEKVQIKKSEKSNHIKKTQRKNEKEKTEETEKKTTKNRMKNLPR